MNPLNNAFQHEMALGYYRKHNCGNSLNRALPEHSANRRREKFNLLAEFVMLICNLNSQNHSQINGRKCIIISLSSINVLVFSYDDRMLLFGLF
jgi:hypothetical protein